MADSPQLYPYGRLSDAAQWLAACQDRSPASEPQRVRAIIFAEEGDGIPQATETAARRVGASIKSVTVTDCSTAYDLGVQAADAEIDGGADLLIPGGIDSTQAAAAVMGVMAQEEPVVVVGKQPSVEDWKAEVAAIRDAMFRMRHLTGRELINACGSPVLAALVGFMSQAARRRTPLLVDAPLTATAACAATDTRIHDWLLATNIAPQPAHRLALKKLRLDPLLDLQMEPVPALGALAALPLVLLGVEITADATQPEA
ncbi:nicotinate-nucleotide--dimethylbenzimidazole phosphoribosyltransferase [Corynebacterium accolens]|uniref:nicotinate-nucleotide--dimethylbenzimidazole phosphoribosyltransferase n=1 Tax=Corynebacterium accolens TaxID=38284 RepID=UPI00307FE573